MPDPIPTMPVLMAGANGDPPDNSWLVYVAIVVAAVLCVGSMFLP